MRKDSVADLIKKEAEVPYECSSVAARFGSGGAMVGVFPFAIMLLKLAGYCFYVYNAKEELVGIDIAEPPKQHLICTHSNILRGGKKKTMTLHLEQPPENRAR